MKKRQFGRTGDGRAVEEAVLESAEAAVSLLSYGCTTRDWRVDGPGGSLPMVLGFPRIEDYEHHAHGHGAIVGRVANRVAGARFTLDGETFELVPNEGPNQLHGGPAGLGKRVLGDGGRQRHRGPCSSSIAARTASRAIRGRWTSPSPSASKARG